MVDLSQYRLNSWNEIRNYLTQSDAGSFWIYLNRIYKALMTMKPEDEIDLLKEVAPENREKFVKIACLFISEGNADYIYSNDYTKLKRLQIKDEARIAEVCELLTIKKNRKKDELDKAEKTNSRLTQ